MKKLSLLNTLFIMFLCSCPVMAQDWQTTNGSSLSFSSSFQGEAFAGSFTKFTPQITFNPKNLKQSRFDVVIDLASANSQNIERDDTLKSSDFFDVKKSSVARFTATQFQALANGKYIAKGQLSLRGISKPVNLQFTWQQNKSAILLGETVLNRLDFNVGIGDWKDISLLPNKVKVSTKLILIRKAPTKS
jgi:polyisoprenoid-binding protein YceI